MTAALDFETEAIEPRPHYPPAPVGLAVATSAKNSRYTRSNLLWNAQEHWNAAPVFHSAQFDIAVGMEKLGLNFPLDGFHDTLYLMALLHPYSPTLSLKPSIEAVLGRAPVEQNDLRDWIIANIPGANKKNFGAFISKAPVELVSPYARQDAAGTLALFNKLMPQLRKHKMVDPYNRERALLPMLLDTEKRGIRVSLRRLGSDVARYRGILAETDNEIRLGFKVKNLDIDSNEQMADAIEKLGVKLPLTDKGNRHTDKDSIFNAAVPARLKALLLYRSKLASDLRTFMLPWLEVALETGGVIHTHWNQVRGSSNRAKRGGGARTGRMSSEPNFQNITSIEKIGETVVKLAALWPGRGWPLPLMRSYIVPWEKGWVLYGRDLNQQELRLLANYEDEKLAALYRYKPDADVHDAVRLLIQSESGIDLPRKMVKICNFLTIYGGGIDAFCAQAGVSPAQGAAIRDVYFKALPSVKSLMREIQKEKAIRTLGGRRYEPESGREYKLLNYLIQGSAADQIKEIMVRWWRQHASASNLFYLQVHDELVFSCPREDVKMRLSEVEALMAETFNSRLAVPFLSDGEVGMNWSNMKEVV